MNLLDTINGRTEPRKLVSPDECWCEYVDIGVGMQRVTEEEACPQHGLGEIMALLVTTETGSYVLDFINSTATRKPRKEVSSTEVYAATLRRDDEAIDVEQIVNLNLGERMVLLLNLRQDGVLTERTTTIVQSIEEIYKNGTKYYEQ